MIFEITSTSNTKYKYVKSLMQKKARLEHGEYTVEGIKSVCDAIEAGKKISVIAVSDKFDMSSILNIDEFNVYKISDNIFSGLCDTVAPQGIIAVLKIEKKDFSVSLEKPYIYCDDVNDPGNLGTIIRTADASGFGGVILSKGCVDIYNPKVVRSSMGSFFHIDIFENCDSDTLINCKNVGFQIFAGALSDDTIEYTDADMTVPTIIVVGNEANGVSQAVLDISDKCVKIPIVGSAESLNVSIAASVLMYEVLRQRRK